MSPFMILVALVSYAAVIVCLTTLKVFFRIGSAWNPINQRRRQLSLDPFNDLRASSNWMIPAFEYGGNIAFFIPYAALLFILLLRLGDRHPLRSTVILGVLSSLILEASQYVFRLGYTDIDDLTMNSIGAFLGALLALIAGEKRHKFWVWLSIGLSLLFAVLVATGEHLEEPPAPQKAAAVTVTSLVTPLHDSRYH